MIISHAVWLYYRFCLSLRDVEDLLAERGITVSYETMRQWSRKFGAEYARKLRRRAGRLGDTWHLDELFVTIQGQRQYLWRAVDQDGDVLDILVQPHRDQRAAKPLLPALPATPLASNGLTHRPRPTSARKTASLSAWASRVTITGSSLAFDGGRGQHGERSGARPLGQRG